MILAGDIGGTHARLAFFDVVDGHFSLVSASVFPSREYRGLDEIVTKFVDSSNVRPDAACFGVAGPVRNGRVEASNLPWTIESKRLADELKLRKALLINDLEANAWGIPALDPKDVVCLNQVKGSPIGNQAVIAAGTGLGEAGMYWDGLQHHVFACEGGHGDFAPRNDLELDLFRYLRDSGRGREPQWLIDEMSQSDPAAAISGAGVQGKCPLCEQAVGLFVSIYGAEAGNLALKILAIGGIYLGGGIAPKLLPKLAGPLFMQAFVSKGRMQSLLESIPVKVITNESIALLGAARCAVVNTQPSVPAGTK